MFLSHSIDRITMRRGIFCRGEHRSSATNNVIPTQRTTNGRPYNQNCIAVEKTFHYSSFIIHYLIIRGRCDDGHVGGGVRGAVVGVKIIRNAAGVGLLRTVRVKLCVGHKTPEAR